MAGDQQDLPGPRPIMFFAPDQIRKRAADWGGGGIEARFGVAWAGLAPKLEQWIDVVESRGPGAVKQVYADTLSGRVPPHLGHMLSLHG